MGSAYELTVTLSVSACDTNCKSCDKNGAKKCDPGKCNEEFGLDSSDSSCKGKFKTLLS